MHAIIYLLLLSTVEVSKPPIMLVGRSGMPRECGDKPIFACTVFREMSLSCTCELGGDGWRILATARAVPYVYTSSLSYLAHEMQHVWDFQSMLEEHVESISEKRFAQRTACDAFAQTSMLNFTATMHKIAQTSTERRDGPQQFRGPARRIARTEAGQ